MAKKKPVKPKAKAVEERKSVAVTMKGSEEWKDWLERASKYCRISISSFLDLAAADYAKSHGFIEEPPER